MKTQVYFIGAGPGDPELITLKGKKALARADVVIYADSLIHPGLLRWAKRGAAIHKSASMTLEEVQQVMLDSVSQGRIVARVHSGDPSLYGALLEQLAFLEQQGITYTVIPGVSSVFAAAAALKTELTAPEISQTVIISRLAGRTPVPEDLRALAAHRTTLVLFLSVASIDKVIDQLLTSGYPEDTPAAVVYRVSWENEKTVRGTLADIASRVKKAGITRQALIMVGKVFSPDLKSSGLPPSRLYDSTFAHQYRTLQGDALQSPIAIIALGKNGAVLAQKLHTHMEHSDLYLPAGFYQGAGRSYDSLKELLPDLFAQYKALVLFMPLGIVIRLLAPLIRDKYHDPAVVTLDEAGKFVVSLLSGHARGANELAMTVARLLKATPVITSAAESLNTLALDLLGKEFGWQIEDASNLTQVSAAIINGRPIGIFQEAGETDWWPSNHPLPENIRSCASLEELRSSGCQAAVIITDRVCSPDSAGTKSAVVCRPKSLVLGLGLHRGATLEELEKALRSTLEKFQLSLLSLRLLATVSLRKDEPGLPALAKKHNLPLVFFTPEELKQVKALPNASPLVARYLGIAGVCEPAALLASRSGELLVPKQKLGNVTMAIARYNFAPEPPNGATRLDTVP